MLESNFVLTHSKNQIFYICFCRFSCICFSLRYSRIIMYVLYQCIASHIENESWYWYKEQSESEIVKSLNEWLEVLIIAFSAKSFAKSSIQTFSFVSFVSFSSQYHSCLNCFRFFSFLTRLLQHNQSTICKKVVCKHCEKIFESNNKFHEHVRQYYTKSMKNEIVEIVSKRNFNREKDKNLTISSTIFSTISSKSTTKFSISRSFTSSKRSRNASLNSFVTSTTSKRSRLL